MTMPSDSIQIYPIDEAPLLEPRLPPIESSFYGVNLVGREDFPTPIHPSKEPQVQSPQETDLPENLAGYDADSEEGPDDLNMSNDVKALCSVMIAKSVQPPLSIGLFGDWGSGKSFFMRQMREYIEEITEEVKRVKKEQEAISTQSSNSETQPPEPAFCDRVVPIVFNAWHYIDANLWASLTHHIFETLAKEVKPEQTLEEQRQHLFKNLASTKKLQAEADQRKSHLEATTLDQQNKIKDIQKKKLFQRRRQEELTAPSVFLSVLEASGAKSQLHDVLKGAGWENLFPINQDFETVVKTGIGWKKRTVAIWKSLNDLYGRKIWWFLACFVVLLGGVALIPYLISSWPDSWKLQASFVGSGVLGSGFLVSVLRFCTRASGTVNNTLQKLELTVTRIRTEAENQRKQNLAECEEMLVELEAQIRKEDHILLRLSDEVITLEKEIQEIQSGRRLYRFIEERSGSHDYKNQLGIVSLIRKDFENLEQLLKAEQDERSHSSQETDSSEPSEASQESETAQIDRIILYIDDLDRCPPDRVVEVLQATHLLLAFKLFVVVVAVDSRWLLRSLQQHYSNFLALSHEDSPNSPEHLGSWFSTPQNYLEKIFQIPFALNPMPAAGYQKLIERLVEIETDPVPDSDVAKEIQDAVENKTREATPSRSGEGGGEKPTKGVRPDPNILAESTKLQQQIDALENRLRHFREMEEESVADFKEEKTGIDLNPTNLKITEDELKCLQYLFPLLASPRITKRLINIYRLIRATLTPPQIEKLRGGTEDPGSYPGLLLLLAIVVGFPTLSSVILKQLKQRKTDDFWTEGLPGMTPKPLERNKSLHNNHWKESFPKPEANEWLRLQNGLHTFQKVSQLSPETNQLRQWIPTVARYSFHSGKDLAQLINRTD